MYVTLCVVSYTGGRIDYTVYTDDTSDVYSIFSLTSLPPPLSFSSPPPFTPFLPTSSY